MDKEKKETEKKEYNKHKKASQERTVMRRCESSYNDEPTDGCSNTHMVNASR
jgi:hypothetical protein